MKYAVIKAKGYQYKVSEGDNLEINRIAGKEGELLHIKDVLLVSDGTKVKIGKPLVKDSEVTAKVTKHYLGEKLAIYKFKAKTGYRRKTGFRAQKTQILIQKIS